MATTPDFIQFVIEQINCGALITYRKMFGEYMVYANGKPIFTVCDNTVFVKKSKGIAPFFENAECGFPYEGAKEHYILDIENTQLTNEVVKVLEEITPLPKKRAPNK